MYIHQAIPTLLATSAKDAPNADGDAAGGCAARTLALLQWEEMSSEFGVWGIRLQSPQIIQIGVFGSGICMQMPMMEPPTQFGLQSPGGCC